ncbi:probable ribonuclease P/MRP protein subunit POP5 [Coccomyxa sp. Obi]|nr:probable ribonuclease P/MRP protein subunit POP5 [Coccomyxa sp. Obi]
MVRFKNRFLLFELIWKDGRIDETLTEANIQAVLRDSLALNFGDYGLGVCLASQQVKYYNPLTNLCIVRCGRDQYKEVLASMTTITTFRYRTVMMHLLHNGGTLASCQRAAIEHNRAILQNMRLTQSQQKLASEAEERFQAMEI